MRPITTAVLACSAAPRVSAPYAAAAPDALAGLDVSVLGHMIGQFAVETGGYQHFEERLGYSPSRLMDVFSAYRGDPEAAHAHAFKPELIANRAYANRNGNGPEASGDGYRYRGRGPGLTGRGNYRTVGEWVGLPLEDQPELASEPAPFWAIARAWFERTRVAGRTLEWWARMGQGDLITRGINGPAMLHAEERAAMTTRARRVLAGEPNVSDMQRALRHEFSPGPVDGIRGPRTIAAEEAAMERLDVEADGLFAAVLRRAAGLPHT
ncbi:hypothetical protein LNKW23_17850 [Paralimibaculum aggregatum]|uniref:Chitinase n=1 Tax=Paralimibaculum aggregatum TaxID=3036245 RepID=A0ABQ6LHV8_9RHOB|nr:hypothetical protein [Limibaculum sp. NKW23]GMG82572.1 hypothetical protein LNKW23_17850 [Limibaculum sp. NKW23]